MTPYHFIGQDRVLEAPDGYDHKSNGECVGLPVKVDKLPSGMPIVSSVWRPTPEQLMTLQRGGAVVLTVWGGQPPVALDVTGPEQLLVPA